MSGAVSNTTWQGRSGLATAPAVFALDAEQRICLWSQGMEHLLGVPTALALGQPCYQVVRAREPANHKRCGPGCGLFRQLQAGHLKSRCRLAIGPDHRATLFRAEAMALPPGVGPRVLVFVHSEGQGAPTMLPSLVQDVAALGHLASALAPADINTTLQGALTIAREATGAEAAEVFLMEPVGHQMVLAGHQGLFRHAFQQITRFSSGEGFPGLVAALGTPVSTEDLSSDGRYLRTLVKEKGFRHYICVPVRGASGVVGCLNIASRRSEANLSARLPLLSTMAAPLGSAIHAWLSQAGERLGDPLPQPALTLEENLRQLLRDIVRPLMEASHASAGGAVIYDPGTAQPILQAAEGEEVGEPGPHDACVCLRERRPIPVASCPGVACGLRRQGTRLCLPLLSNQDALGVVWLVPGEALASGAPLSMVSAMAQRAAALLSHALAYRQLHRQALQVEHDRLAQAVGRAVGAPAVVLAGEPILDIRCLGPFQALRNGRPLPVSAFPRRQALVALKLLVAHRGKPVPGEVLMEHLWPDADPAVALNRLHGVIHALRQAVEPSPAPPWRVILTQGDNYYLDTGACRVDVDGFLSGFRQGRDLERRDQPQEALAAYQAAARLYQGDFLEDEPYAEWCWEEREHLRETYLEILRRLAALRGARGELEESIHCLREALRVDPVREELHRELMDSLARAGRRDEAVRQFQVCSQLLRRELGVGPLPQTEAVYRKLLRSAGP